MTASVSTLLPFDDGTGASLFAGGRFEAAFDSGDSFLARWGCPETTPPTITCPGPQHVLDPGGTAPGEIVTFDVTATDDLDPFPIVVCVPPSGSLFPRGTTFVTCTATDASGNQATCGFPVTVSVDAADRPAEAR